MPLTLTRTWSDIVTRILCAAQRVEIPPECPAALCPVLQQCLFAAPEERPTIEQFTDVLRPIVEELCACDGSAAVEDPVQDYGDFGDDDIDVSLVGSDLVI